MQCNVNGCNERSRRPLHNETIIRVIVQQTHVLIIVLLTYATFNRRDGKFNTLTDHVIVRCAQLTVKYLTECFSGKNSTNMTFWNMMLTHFCIDSRLIELLILKWNKKKTEASHKTTVSFISHKGAKKKKHMKINCTDMNMWNEERKKNVQTQHKLRQSKWLWLFLFQHSHAS